MYVYKYIPPKYIEPRQVKASGVDVYVYIHIYACMYIDVRTCICTYIYEYILLKYNKPRQVEAWGIYVYIYIYIYIHDIYIHVCALIHAHVYVHIQIYASEIQ